MPTSTGSFPVTLMVSDSLGRSANPQNFALRIVTHGFKSTGSMFGVDLEGGRGGAREFPPLRFSRMAKCSSRVG